MRLPNLLLVGVLLAGAATAPAQTAGRHAGLFLGFSNLGTSAASAIGLVDASNRLTSYTSIANGAWPYWGNVWGATLDTDNETVLLAALIGFTNPPAQYGLVAWDPNQKAVVKVLWSGFFGVNVPQNLTNLAVNSDGNPVSFDSGTGNLVEFDRLAATWRATRLTVPNNSGLGGFVWDKLAGGYLYANSGSTAVNQQVLVRTRADHGGTTTIAATSLASWRAAYGGDLLDDGTWISSCLASSRYLEVPGGIAGWSAGPPAAAVYWDVSAEKFAAPGRGYYAAVYSQPQLLLHADAATSPHTVTTLINGSTSPMPSWMLEIQPLFRRDLATRRSAKSTWDVLINPGGGILAGKSFVVGASLSGARPPVRVAGGRELFLVPDSLTVLTVQGPLPPFLTGNHGVLDAGGRGRARLDLGLLGTSANGVVVHLGGLILDPAAPGGVAWVLDPWAFVINVQP